MQLHAADFIHLLTDNIQYFFKCTEAKWQEIVHACHFFMDISCANEKLCILRNLILWSFTARLCKKVGLFHILLRVSSPILRGNSACGKTILYRHRLFDLSKIMSYCVQRLYSLPLAGHHTKRTTHDVFKCDRFDGRRVARSRAGYKTAASV